MYGADVSSADKQLFFAHLEWVDTDPKTTSFEHRSVEMAGKRHERLSDHCAHIITGLDKIPILNGCSYTLCHVPGAARDESS